MYIERAELVTLDAYLVADLGTAYFVLRDSLSDERSAMMLTIMNNAFFNLGDGMLVRLYNEANTLYTGDGV